LLCQVLLVKSPANLYIGEQINLCNRQAHFYELPGKLRSIKLNSFPNQRQENFSKVNFAHWFINKVTRRDL
jgi:hypothetical protein